MKVKGQGYGQEVVFTLYGLSLYSSDAQRCEHARSLPELKQKMARFFYPPIWLGHTLFQLYIKRFTDGWLHSQFDIRTRFTSPSNHEGKPVGCQSQGLLALNTFYLTWILVLRCCRSSGRGFGCRVLPQTVVPFVLVPVVPGLPESLPFIPGLSVLPQIRLRKSLNMSSI